MLFELHSSPKESPLPNYDVAADGQHFIMIKDTGPEATATEIDLVLNWFENLKQRMPAEKK